MDSLYNVSALYKALEFKFKTGLIQFLNIQEFESDLFGNSV